MRNCHTVFHSGCNNLHFHQQCTSVLFSPRTCQHLSFGLFLMIVILTGVSWYLTVDFICMSLMISDVEQSFHVPVGHLHFHFGNNVYSFLFLIGFLFSILSYMSCLHILGINTLFVASFRNIFSHLVCCLFSFIDGFLCCAKAFIFLSSIFYIFILLEYS